MAEGGFDEFENPTFDRDDYDDDGIDRDEAETSFTDEAQFQRTPKNQFDAIKDLTGVERENQLKEVGKSLIKTFYDRNQEAFTRVKGVYTIVLFIQYLKRNTQLATIAILPCGRL